MKKRVLALLLAMTMLLSLAACNKGGAKKVDTKEHVKITYMFTGSKPEGAAMDRFQEMNKKLNEILTEKCNAELEFYWIGWTDYLSVYNMNIAAQDGTVDLIGTASDWLDAWPNAKNGGFKILTEDMLKTYAPETWKSVPADHWELC